MSGRSITLNALKSGINRLRTKGGASPNSLYDLVNGYVDISGNAVSRPGTLRDAVIPAGTKGLCVFQGKFVVFASTPVTMTDGRYRCEVLSHPTDATQTIAEIHFAAPFMGYLYVAAEFANGDVFHYWLQSGNAWTASTFFLSGALVVPTMANGLAYTASTSVNPAAWKANTAYAVGAVVQPSVYNGYEYTLIEADGTSPASGATEPTWLATEGALVTEDVDHTPAPTTTTTPTTTPNSGRYGNLPGIQAL